jgi:hypothetical protein
LSPTAVTGNASSGDLQDVLAVSGTLSANWSLPYAGLPVVLKNSLTVPSGKTLTLAAGTVLKADPSASLQINGTLAASGTAASPVTITGIKDDSVGGDTNNDSTATTPAAGDWGGIYLATGSGATSAPTLNLAFTRVSYDSQLNVGTASAVSITNSTFLRGPGSGYGVGGLQISASGPIAVTNNTITGLANPGTWSSQGITVTQTGTASTVVSSNTVQSADSVAVSVSSPQSITVQNNTVSGGTGRAFELSSQALSGAAITGNTATGDQQNLLAVSGTLSANWSLPYAGLPVVLKNSLTVPSGKTLTLAAGTVLKAEQGAALNVDGTLTATGTAASHVVLTSMKDDTAGGDTNNDSSATTPAAGDWPGIQASATSTVALTNTELRYASTALYVADGGNATISGAVLHSTVGVSSNQWVDASNVDWGSPSGPAPLGSGTPVQGSGVSFTPWIGFVAPPRPTPPPPTPPSVVPTCPNVLFVGARGSGDWPQGNTSYSSDETQNMGRMDQVYHGFTAQLTTLAQTHAGLPTPTPMGLAYPAAAADNPLNYLDGVFFASFWSGEYEITYILQHEQQRCGGSEKIVLAGYSQGALAIHLALDDLRGTAAIANVKAVLLLADPAKRGDGAETHFGTANVGANGIYDKIFGAPQIPSSVVPATATLCHNHDIVCAPGWGANTGEHTNYGGSELAQLGAWGANKVVLG